jgi:predicted GIY-YIG superfamily endonuclease
VQPFYVYIVRCSDGSLYVGHTDDLELWLAHHAAGTFDGYTARRRPVELVFTQEMASRDDAFERERQLKGWSRAKKMALARGDWTEVRRLAGRRPG